MTCRLCGCEHMQLKYTITRFDSPFDVYLCPDCAFEQQDIAESEAYQFYDEAYYKGQKAFAYIDERDNEKASRIVWKRRFNILRRKDHTPGQDKNFLDVGCSFGGLMAVAQEKGYHPYGVEVSSYSAAHAARRFGTEHLYTGNIEEISLPSDFFSIVSMIEVVEHIYRPKKALANICQSMKKGGVFLVQTANMAGLQAKQAGPDYHYYLPGHLSYFNRFNLAQALRDAGFSRVRFIGGVEFGLLPKLLKSRAGFKTPGDYAQWLRIAWYHLLSRIPLGRQRLTSSMVILAWK